MFEKYALNTSHNSASFVIFLLPSLRNIFSPLDGFICEKRNNCLPKGSVICCLRSVKIVKELFFAFFKSFLQ